MELKSSAHGTIPLVYNDPYHWRARALEARALADKMTHAHQASFKEIEDISDEEWELTLKVNMHAMFYLTKAAVRHMKPGSAISNTASINSDSPNPILLEYATTKGAIHNFTAELAQLLAKKGIRGNAVAPGPIWTAAHSVDASRGSGRELRQGCNVPASRPSWRRRL